MNWDDLKLFLAVSRCKSISGAAKQLNIQHSTVSRRIKCLEASLGLSLLTRVNNAYQLTNEGVRIERAAINMEKELLEVDGALTGKADSLTGSLRITTISTMASSILMPIFDSFCQAHPHIDLHIIVSNETVSLTHREADIAIRWSNNPPDNLIGKKITSVASTVYGSVNYIKKTQLSGDERWIGAKCCDFHDSWTKQTAVNKQYQFTSNDPATIMAAVQAGLGLTFLPCFIGDVDPLLARYCAPLKRFDLGLWVLYHPELKHNLRVTAFKKHLVHAIEQQKYLLKGSA